MNIRVGLIHYGLDRQAAGIGRYTVQLTRSLAGHGLSVHRLWAGRRPAQADGEMLRGAYRLPGLLTIIGQGEIAYQARRLRLDVVHDPSGVMPLLLTGTTRVVTIHDTVPYVYPETSTRLDWLIYHVWLPLAARKADAVVTDSERSRQDIVTYLSVARERVLVVPGAADPTFRPMQGTEVERTLYKYGIRRPYVLYLGALEPRKNLPRLLQAYARLRQALPGWQMVIVGARKWKFAPIFETVQRLQLELHVRFTGYVAEADLPALYNGADLFAFPSLYEGFGLPVLEAMACGTPVVTSNSSSLPEVAGNAALLVDPCDVEQIVQAMRQVLSESELAAQMRAQGLARAAQFSWERAARETVAVYERALTERRA